MKVKLFLKKTISPKSQSFEHVLSSAESKGAALLQIEHLNDAVFCQKGVPSGPNSQSHRLVTQVELTANSLSEHPVPIRQQKHFIVDSKILLPGPHNEGVVHGNAGDGVDAFGFQLGGFLDEAREVFLGAGGGEGAGDGEEDCFFVGGEVGDGDGLELASGVKVGEGGVGELVAHGNGGGDWRGFGGEREFCGGGFCEEAVAEGEIF